MGKVLSQKKQNIEMGAEEMKFCKLSTGEAEAGQLFLELKACQGYRPSKN